MRYYEQIQGAFENGQRRGARSRAQAYAQSGDYDAAADSLMDADPGRSAAYRSRADRGAAQEVGRAVAAGETNRARKIAADRGDLDTVNSLDEQQRLSAYRNVSQYASDLEQIETLPETERPGAFTQLIDQAIADTKRQGQDTGWLDQLRQYGYNPRLVGNLRTRLNDMRNQLLTPQQSATLEATQNRSSGRYATPEEVAANGYRPGTVLWIPDAGRPIVSQAPLAPSTSRSGDPTRLPSGYVLE